MTVTLLRPMVEAYRLWATGRMSASDFGAIADKAIIASDRVAPDSVQAVPIEPLTEYESVQAAAVFHDLTRREDPLALVRTIEHVLKIRRQSLLSVKASRP